MLKINLSTSDKNISKSHSLIIQKLQIHIIRTEVNLMSTVMIPDDRLSFTNNYYFKYKLKS
jgi:hypothetical protein